MWGCHWFIPKPCFIHARGVSCRWLATVIGIVPFRPNARRRTIRAPSSDNRDQEHIDWDDVRDYVVDRIKRVGRRIDVEKVRKYVDERSDGYDYGRQFDAFIDNLTKRGYLTPSRRHKRRPPRPSRPARPFGMTADDTSLQRDSYRDGETDGSTEQSGLFRTFNRYRERIRRKLRRTRTGFRVHLSVFAGVNIFLLMIWGITGGGFPWFLIPAAGWAIGIANHLNVFVQRIKQSRELAAQPDLTNRETRLVSAMHSARTSFGSHLTTAVSVSLFFAIIHAITGGGFPWHLIPSGVLALAVFIHYSNYGPKVRRMRRTITDWIRGRRRMGEVDGSSASAEELGEREPAIIQEASAIRRAIIQQAAGAKTDGIDIGSDLETLLDTYVAQIRSLASKSADMDRLVAELPIVELEKDRATLVRRRTRAESDAVRLEYDKSIAEVDQQIASLKEVEQSREVIDLRLRSAMNLMKQLQIDLARAKGATISNTSSFDLLRSKSDELSTYIRDLEAGYSELET